MFIRAKNYDVSDKVKTTLASSVSSGGGTLTVRDTSGFANNDYIVVGVPGKDRAEIQQISSVASKTSLSLSGTLDFDHGSDTQVAFIKYNQVRFYLGDTSSGYSTGSITVTHDSTTVTGSGTSWSGTLDTTYSLLINGKFYDIASVDSNTQVTLSTKYEEETVSGMSYNAIPFSAQTTIGAQIDREYTSWDDTDGISEDYYRVAYYNNTTTTISALSDVISAEGTDRDAVRKLVTDIRVQTGERLENSTSFSDEEIMVLIDEAQEDVWSKSKDFWWWDTDTNLTTVASQESYDLPDDFFAALSVRGNDGTNETNDLKEVSYQEYRELQANNSSTNNNFSRFAIWGGRIYIYPTPTSGVTAGIKLLYRAKPTELNSGGDITRIPETRVLKYYVIAKILEIQGEVGRADRMLRQYQDARDRMLLRSRRYHGKTQRFRFNPSYDARRISTSS